MRSCLSRRSQFESLAFIVIYYILIAGASGGHGWSITLFSVYVLVYNLRGVYTPHRVRSQILVLWLPQFLHAPTQNSKIWRRAVVVAIPKPEKPLGDPKSYRPISLLYVPFKILDRLIYARVETIIDPLLPQEQAGFRHGRSAVDQVTLLT